MVHQRKKFWKKLHHDPTGMTSTSENDFIFFMNGQYMEHNVIEVEQKGTSFLLKVDVSGIGYNLESDDEIIAFTKV